MKKVCALFAVAVALMMTGLGVTHAESKLDTTTTVYNETKNADGAKVKASPGDVLTYTMTVSNLGPDDLVDWLPLVNIEDILPYADIIHYGTGAISDEIFIEYTPVIQTADCDCADTFEFTIQIKDSVCIDYTSAEKLFPIVVFEDSGVGINIECEAPKPVVVEEPVKVPESGPEVMILGLLAVIGSLGATRMYFNR